MGVDVGYIGEGDGAAGNPPGVGTDRKLDRGMSSLTSLLPPSFFLLLSTDGKTKTLGVSAPCSSPSTSSGVPGSSSTPGIIREGVTLLSLP